MYRTFVILRHTFLEAAVQPIFTLILGVGATILVIFGALPFFTLGEDTAMFKSVALDVMLLLVLIATLFATSKSIYEEIEDRTMLTLMSKPVRRWEVLLGKYLGIALSALLAIAVLGLVLALCTWWRVPTDNQLSTSSLDDRVIAQIRDIRMMHLAGLVPAYFAMWLQVSVLAAISVAISTRVSLVVNLPVVILIYIAGNLTRFLFPMDKGSGGTLAESPVVVKGFAWLIANVLPYLENFDLKQKTVHSTVALKGSMFEGDVNSVTVAEIWSNVGAAGLYATCYVAMALIVGLLLFQNRELGGGEG